MIWAYVQHLQFGNRFPAYVDVPPFFLRLPDRHTKTTYISEWELETLTREVIIHAPESSLSGKSLQNGSYYSQTINKVKSLEYGMSGFYVGPNNAIREMYRIAHRQFPWQSEHPSFGELEDILHFISRANIESVIGEKYETQK